MMKKILNTYGIFRTGAGKWIIGLLCAFLVGEITTIPAFSQEYRRPLYEHRRYDRHAYYHRRVYRPYVPPPPIYAPPPVVYAPPPPPPGIQIFFPPIIIR